MKENNKQVVFYSAEKDGFLMSYKDKGNLAFTATFDDRLWKGLQLPFEPYEKQKTELDKLAELNLTARTLNARSVNQAWKTALKHLWNCLRSN